MSNALNRLGIEPIVTADPEELKSADKVILPGVGEASTAMNSLKKNGLVEPIKSLTQPFLGVCLGLQLMCQHSEENDTTCLGVFDMNVKKFEPKLKVPHIGWNRILPVSNGQTEKNLLWEGLESGAYFYFVHSYYAALDKSTIGNTSYINDFSAVIQRDNFSAIQAHPEKSGKDGERFLANFLSIK